MAPREGNNFTSIWVEPLACDSTSHERGLNQHYELATGRTQSVGGVMQVAVQGAVGREATFPAVLGLGFGLEGRSLWGAQHHRSCDHGGV